MITMKRVLTDNPAELLKMFRFRFDEYSQWIQYPVVNNLRLDIDPYDEDVLAYWCGYNEENQIISSHRIIKRPNKFMLESEFPGILEGVSLGQSGDIGEVSRFALRDDCQGIIVSEAFEGCGVLSMSCREAYKVSLENGIRFLYMALQPGRP